jgi:hypothetical protein
MYVCMYVSKYTYILKIKRLSETFLIRRRIQRDIVIYMSSVKALVVLFRLQRNFEFCRRVSKNTQIQNFVKIRPVGAELFHADGHT